MNRKALLLASVSILLLALAGYGLYRYLNLSKPAALRSLVPPDAVLVYSSPQASLAWDSLQQHPFGEMLRELPLYQRLQSYGESLEQLLSDNQDLLSDREVLFSLHITERNSFDYLLLMPLQTQGDQRLLKKLREAIAQQPERFKLSERTYLGEQLVDVMLLKEGQTFSFFVQEGALVGSFTSFLVEAALRHYKESASDAHLSPWLREAPGNSLSESLGSVYLNLQQLPALLRVFAHSDSLVQEVLPRLPYYGQLELVPAPDGMLLSGFTSPLQTEDPDFLWALQDQRPQAMRLEFLVPMRTATLMFLGLSHPGQWHDRLKKYWEGKAPQQWERWQVLEAKAPAAAKFVSLIGNEAGLATIPGIGAAPPERLLLLQLKDSAAAASLVQEMVAQLSATDTLYSESFLGQQLQELPYEDFPAAALGSAFLGFKESYYTIKDQYLIIGSSIPALKEMLLDVQAEETWQRSVRLNKFLSRLDKVQNYGLYLNTTTLWPLLYSRLAQPWKVFWDQHGLALRQSDLLSLQLSAADGAFYTNLFLHLDLRPERRLEQIRLIPLVKSQLPAPVVHAPVGVTYRQQRGAHWLVQDTARNLHLINQKGELLRSRQLEGYWRQHTLAELDPQKNKNTHYFLTTSDSVYLLKPQLNTLRPFPLALPANEKIQWSRVIDYDGSRRYRFLLASPAGNLYMYDLDGINLEGWQPLKLGGALSAEPGHIRVRSKDIIYAYQQKGVVHAFTRKGAYFPGFPLNLGDSLLGPVQLRQGSDFKSTRFVTVTASGLLLEWDLEGRELARRQLYRPDVRAHFYLVPDNRGKKFLIAQQDRFRLRLLDEAGQELFEKDYLGASSLHVQYFTFPDAAALVAVTDPDQEFTYFYDLAGNLLQTQPLNSCCPVDIRITASGDSLRLIKAYDKTLEQYMLPVINSGKGL